MALLGDSHGHEHRRFLRKTSAFVAGCAKIVEASRVPLTWRLKNEFDKRGVKVAALSCNSVDDHKGWVKDINAYCNTDVWYPIIEDLSRDLAVLYGMIDPEEKDAKGLPMTCRAVFFIGPDKKVKAKILYPPSTGRAFGEILRVIDSLQLAVNHSVATPVDWQPGDSCMILPTVSAEDAVTKFPKGFTVAALPSGKPYIRRTPQPNVDAKKGLARFPKETPWVIGVAAAVGVFAAALFRKQ
eukprot:jgi/Mesvir1/2421/Mv22157-RA.1